MRVILYDERGYINIVVAIDNLKRGERLCVTHMPNEVYHDKGTPGVGASQLGTFLESPADYQAELKTPKKQTPALKFGSDFHDMMHKPFSLKQRKDVKKEDHDKMLVMHRNVLHHRYAGRLCFPTHDNAQVFYEVSIFWRDEETGLICKCRPDVWRPDLRLVIDYKTTTSLDTDKLMRTIADFKYHMKAAHYLVGAADVKFVWVFVKKSGGHGVRCVNAGREQLTVGKYEREFAMRDLKKCIETDTWPGPEEVIIEGYLPKYYKFK